LLGTFYLLELDWKMAELDVKYFRYMDGILILAPTRWKLRKAIRVLNQTFDELKLKQHPDKTLIGRVERGFDFLGYHFRPFALYPAAKTVENFVARIARLYEQEPDGTSSFIWLGEYVQRWLRWLRGGIPFGIIASNPVLRLVYRC